MKDFLEKALGGLVDKPKDEPIAIRVTDDYAEMFRKMNDDEFLKWCYKNPFTSKSGLNQMEENYVLMRLSLIQGKRYIKTGDPKSFQWEKKA